MFQFIRPALTAASPYAMRAGAAAWGYTMTGGAIVASSSMIYVIGRSTTHMIDRVLETGIDKASAYLREKRRSIVDKTVSAKADAEIAKRRVEDEIAYRVALEVKRRIDAGELRASMDEAAAAAAVA